MSLSEKYRPVRFEDMWEWPESSTPRAITNDQFCARVRSNHIQSYLPRNF